MNDRTRLGLTINPEFVQCEGPEAVIGNAVGRLGASVVATIPAVMEPSDDAAGGREPPFDAGLGKDRLLDRELWGRRWLYVRSAPSFAPNRPLYAGLAFQPPEPDRLTDREGPKVAAFLAALKRHGVETHMQIMAAAPPCYRVQSRGTAADAEPRTAAGQTVDRRVDANLSLAHPDLRGYVAALVRDLVDNYPDMDMIRFDWPEYPPYHPDSLSFDFSAPAMRFGQSLGFDAEGLRARLVECVPKLKALAREGAAASPDAGVSLEDLKGIAEALPAVAELLRYRRALVVDYAGFLAETVRHASGGRVGCYLQCFPPPLNVLSGFSIPEIDPLVSDIGVKLYTMHWPMIERAYVERLLDFAGGDPERHLAAVRELLGMSPKGGADFSKTVYPQPDQPHPAPDAFIERKIRAAAAKASHARLWGLTHSYGPVEDVVRRFRAVRRAAGGNVHINRYGYLSDDKIAALEGALANES